MDITDYTKEFNVPLNDSHSILFPKHIFCVIAGSTGSGKTDLTKILTKYQFIHLRNFGKRHHKKINNYSENNLDLLMMK